MYRISKQEKEMTAEHNRITAPFICEVDYDGHEMNCYGEVPYGELAEVEQIAFKGLDADVIHMLDPQVIKSIEAMVDFYMVQVKGE
jgi:hypothetical protein